MSGLLAFTGYVLLEFVMDGNCTYGDLSSLAIAVGEMMAQCFKRKLMSNGVME